MSRLLRINLLGEPQILLDDAPLTGFISGKAQALLIYLAATKQTHTRDTLATLFWDGMPESSAKKNLTKALSNLRKLLGELIDINTKSAGLAWSRDLQVDLILLDDAVAAEDIIMLQEAIILYRGDFLSGFHVRDAMLFEEWVWTERTRLHQLALQAVEQLADHFSAQQQFGKAIGYLRQMLELDPLLEPAHAQLMVVFEQSGQRGAALEQYERCVRVLDEELGVEPGVEIQMLYQRLKRGQEPTPHNIPSLSPIVGREIELAETMALLDSTGCRLLTLVGPGGIGKTELALHIGAGYASPDQKSITSFPDGVYIVRLASSFNVASVLAATAEAIGFAFQEQGGPLEQLCGYARNKSMLLIMDNFEHLRPGSIGSLAADNGDSVALLTRLLDESEGLKILTTSRIRLGIQSEHVFHLAGVEYPQVESLPTPYPRSPVGMDSSNAVIPSARHRPQGSKLSSTDIDDLASYGAVALFETCARRLRPDFRLTAVNIQSVVGICQFVQGMPLGILLAASWITVLSPSEILSELGRGPDLLETEEGDVPLRQRSVRAAFEHTWQMLSPREQETYAKLSYFESEFTREAAQQATEASLHDLMSMVDKSLLTPAIEGRFALHGLLRQYGLEKLEQLPDQRSAVRHSHGRYYANQLERRALEFKGPEQETALLNTEANGENIRAAWQWALAHASPNAPAAKESSIEPIRQMIDGLCQFYAWRGRFGEGAQITRECTDVLSGYIDAQPDDDEAVLLFGHSLSWQGKFARFLGNASDASRFINRGLEALESIGESALDFKGEKAFLLLNMGDAIRESDREAARRYYDDCLELYGDANDAWGRANALAAQGWLIQHWGNYNEARKIYHESLSLRRALGDIRGEAESLRSVAGVALYQGYLEEAEQLTWQSIEIAEKIGDRAGKAASLGKLGETQIALGQFKNAIHALNESLKIYLDLGLEMPSAYTKSILGLGYLHFGRDDQALVCIRQALAYFQEQDSRRGIAYASLLLGWTLLGDETIAEARESLDEARMLYEILGQRDELGQAYALLGMTDYLQGNSQEAETHLQLALEIADDINAFMPRALATVISAWHRRQQVASMGARPDEIGPDIVQPQLDPSPLDSYPLDSYPLDSYPIVARSRWFSDLAIESARTS